MSGLRRMGLLLILLIAGTARGFRDPFSLPPLSKPNVPRKQTVKEPPRVARPLPRLQLRGIIIHRNEYVALINGNILRLHDTIGGAEVVAIDAARVVLKYAGKEYTLELK